MSTIDDWDTLKDNLPNDHAAAAEALFDMGDRLADEIGQLKKKIDLQRLFLTEQVSGWRTGVLSSQEAMIAVARSLEH